MNLEIEMIKYDKWLNNWIHCLLHEKEEKGGSVVLSGFFERRVEEGLILSNAIPKHCQNYIEYLLDWDRINVVTIQNKSDNRFYLGYDLDYK